MPWRVEGSNVGGHNWALIMIMAGGFPEDVCPRCGILFLKDSVYLQAVLFSVNRIYFSNVVDFPKLILRGRKSFFPKTLKESAGKGGRRS